MGFLLLFFYILQTGLQPEEGFSFCCHLISLVAAVREIMFAVHMNCEKHWGESFPLTESKTNLWNIFQIKKYQWRALSAGSWARLILWAFCLLSSPLGCKILAVCSWQPFMQF